MHDQGNARIDCGTIPANRQMISRHYIVGRLGSGCRQQLAHQQIAE
jgi:hypothetical protein